MSTWDLNKLRKASDEAGIPVDEAERRILEFSQRPGVEIIETIIGTAGPQVKKVDLNQQRRTLLGEDDAR